MRLFESLYLIIALPHLFKASLSLPRRLMIADVRLHRRRGYRFARQILVEELPSALTVGKIPKTPLNPLHDCRIGCEIDGLANRELSRLRARDAALRLKDLIDGDEFVDIGL